MNKNDLRICLINPPSPFLINSLVFPPLGLLTLSSVFKQNGYNNIQFIDIASNIDYGDTKADIFFIYVATPNWESAKEVITNLRKNNISSKFVVGGPHPSVNPQDCQWADVIVIGEGEIVSLQILKDYPNVRKIYNEIQIKNLDDIPFPDRSILDVKLYANNYELRGIPTTTYITSRGCSYGKCAFCCKYWVPGTHVRYRSAQNIVDEVQQVQEKYDINGAMFFDDTFLSYKNRLKEFCKLIKPLNVSWRCLSRVESIDEKIIPMLADCGCIEIALGIESADQNILNTINKNINIERAEKSCNIIKDSGIDLKELFIVGLPGESHESLQKMDDFVEITQPFDVDFTVLSVFPGSNIWEHPEKYDIKFNKKCKSHYKGVPGEYINKVCKISTSNLTFEEIIEWREKLERKYKPKEKLMTRRT